MQDEQIDTASLAKQILADRNIERRNRRLREFVKYLQEQPGGTQELAEALPAFKSGPLDEPRVALNTEFYSALCSAMGGPEA